jgi:hypothetical protein
LSSAVVVVASFIGAGCLARLCHAIFTRGKKFPLGTEAAMCRLKFVPMTVTQKHLRGCAGTSFTKAVASICRDVMCPVARNWSKQQQTGTGYQA